MNDNDINVLLDHFVGGLDSSESANIDHKINTIPLWSKTYKQINLVFGSLNAIKEDESQKPAPDGLASKTFQLILEQKKAPQTQPEFIAQKPTFSEQTVSSTSHKRTTSVKPSFLVLSACAGFLLIVAIAVLTSFFGNSTSNNISKPGSVFADNNSSVNNPTDFAVTGSSQQPTSSFFFCSDAVSGSPAEIPFSNNANSFAVNSSEQLVDLTGKSVRSVPEQRETPVRMSCPDNIVVLASQAEGRPIILVQPHRLPGGLQKIQDVVNPSNVDIVTPVNYQK
ncbi:MAG: hypothetical protein IJF84_05685 [Thermoguttaceae bacterium]|nr:hypothetical protein [Thermoguttaceae bacterium]